MKRFTARRGTAGTASKFQRLQPPRSISILCSELRLDRSLNSATRAKRPAPSGVYPSGAVASAKEPVSRILSCAVIPLGAASPRTLISDLPGGFGNCSNRLSRIGPIRLAAGFFGFASPSLFGLAPCGVYHASRLTTRAVRSYRTFSPLPRRGTCRPGEPERVSGVPACRERREG